MAHLTNFSFEFFYKIFTEDASLPFLYHGAKKSKMTKNSNQGGSCLKPDRFNVVVTLYVLNGMSLTCIHVDAYASTDPVGSISAKEAEPIDVIKAVWFSMDTPRLLYANKKISVTSESSSILLKRLRAFRERNVYRAGWGKIWEGGGRVGCALGPLTGVIAQGWDYLALIFSLLVSRSQKTQGRAYERPGQN